MDEESKSEDMSASHGFVLGVMLTIIAVAIMVLIASWASNEHPCGAGRAMLERAEVRIMTEEEFSFVACRFATDEGFLLYYDGQLYFEAGDGE